MNGAMTELSAKIMRSAKISKRKIMGPSQYLFLKRINCQNSEKMEKREKKLMLSPLLWSASSVTMRLVHLALRRMLSSADVPAG